MSPSDKGKQELSVCVAIPTYNRERVLIDTLEQVLMLDPPADEVLVIDQTSDHEPETTQYLTRADKSGRMRWIRQVTPNLPLARNRALSETGCDILIYIDDDVNLSKDFVENHKRNYSDPKVVAVAGRIIQDGLLVPKKKKWPRIMDHRFFYLGSSVKAEGIARLGGGNHSARVSSLKQIGGYDINYIGWALCEDVDMALRLWKSGGCIVFDPQAKLIHLATLTGGCRLKIQNKPLPEWKVSFPETYFTIRHLFPTHWFWHNLFIRNVRRYILRKDNVYRPWRLPWAILSYIYSVFYALWLCVLRGGVK